MLGLIPIHDDNPTRNPAIVNWTLIAINVVVFFLSPISPLDIGGDANTPAGFCRQQAIGDIRNIQPDRGDMDHQREARCSQNGR